VNLSVAAVAIAFVAAAVAGAWFKGREYERDKVLSAQLAASVTITGRQRAATVREVIAHGERKADTAALLPGVQRSIVARCLGLLPDGVPVHAGADRASVSAAGAGDSARAAAGRAQADAAWCQDLAADYATGAEALDDLKLCLGWIDANGGADPAAGENGG
jgi:hypothetical protein